MEFSDLYGLAYTTFNYYIFSSFVWINRRVKNNNYNLVNSYHSKSNSQTDLIVKHKTIGN